MILFFVPQRHDAETENQDAFFDEDKPRLESQKFGFRVQVFTSLELLLYRLYVGIKCPAFGYFYLSGMTYGKI